jgi:hypothetical protein
MSDASFQVLLSAAAAAPFVLLGMFIWAVPARHLRSLGLERAYRWQLVGAASLLLYGVVHDGPALFFKLVPPEQQGTSAWFLPILVSPIVFLMMALACLAVSATADRERRPPQI